MLAIGAKLKTYICPCIHVTNWWAVHIENLCNIFWKKNRKCFECTEIFRRRIKPSASLIGRCCISISVPPDGHDLHVSLLLFLICFFFFGYIIFIPLVWSPTSVLPLISFLPQFYPPTRHRCLSSTRTDGFRLSLTSGAHSCTQYIHLFAHWPAGPTTTSHSFFLHGWDRSRSRSRSPSGGG